MLSFKFLLIIAPLMKLLYGNTISFQFISLILVFSSNTSTEGRKCFVQQLWATVDQKYQHFNLYLLLRIGPRISLYTV